MSMGNNIEFYENASMHHIQTTELNYRINMHSRTIAHAHLSYPLLPPLSLHGYQWNLRPYSNDYTNTNNHHKRTNVLNNIVSMKMFYEFVIQVKQYKYLTPSKQVLFIFLVIDMFWASRCEVELEFFFKFFF